MPSPSPGGARRRRRPGRLRSWLERALSRPSAQRRQLEETIRRAVPRPSDRLQRVERLGEGGMATVDAVIDRALRRRLAMKLLQPGLQEDSRAVQSFLREAQITGQLDHPNIVPVHDLGIAADGRLYFTMKLLSGRTLAEILESLPDGQLDRERLYDLLEIVLRVCDALAFAHQHGVIHRDVKPENVMVGEFGQVYLVDWGLARLQEGARGAMEGEGDRVSSTFDRVWGDAVIGTPAYMSPEQAAGGDLDERADVFAVGAVLYCLLARRAPYEGSTSAEVFRQAMQGKPRPLRQAARDASVPRELERLVGRAMAPLPQDRYATVSELRQDLVAFMRGGGLPRVQFEPGCYIMREGDLGEEAYIIVSGRCEVFKTIDGERVSMRTIGPGESFGEMAIIAASPRTASVVALESTTVERLTRQELLEELAMTKPWMGVLLRTLSERFREREADL